MKKTAIFGAALAMMAFASCSHSDNFVGAWQSTKPIDLSQQLPDAATGSALMTLEFGPNTGKGGTVTINSLLEATQAVVPSPALNEGYEVSIAGTATINGTWAYEDRDDDDLILTLDLTSLNVNVDNNGVTFRQNVVTDAQEPVADSLSTVTADLWRQQFAHALRIELNRYTKLDDVKVRDSVLTFELDHPDQKMEFRKAL